MRALDRVITLLEAVAANGDPVPTAVIARRVGLSLSTVSRLMRDLADAGLLDREAGTGDYVLGSRLVAMARSGAESSSLLRVALPVMESLRDLTQETVSLHVRNGDNRVCIAEVQSLQPVRRVVPQGLVVQLHCGATGEALLAHVPDNVLEGYLSRITISAEEMRRLRQKLEAIRRKGWEMAVDSVTPGVAGLAAPILAGDTGIASLAVSGPSFRWTETSMSRYVEPLVEAAHHISLRMHGGQGEAAV